MPLLAVPAVPLRTDQASAKMYEGVVTIDIRSTPQSSVQQAVVRKGNMPFVRMSFPPSHSELALKYVEYALAAGRNPVGAMCTHHEIFRDGSVLVDIEHADAGSLTFWLKKIRNRREEFEKRIPDQKERFQNEEYKEFASHLVQFCKAVARQLLEYCLWLHVVMKKPHGNLSPAAITARKDGNMLVVPYGCVTEKMVEQNPFYFLTFHGYTCPEVATSVKNRANAGHANDIWAVGAILWSIMSGKLLEPDHSDNNPAFVQDAYFDQAAKEKCSAPTDEMSNSLVAQLASPSVTASIVTAVAMQIGLNLLSDQAQKYRELFSKSQAICAALINALVSVATTADSVLWICTCIYELASTQSSSSAAKDYLCTTLLVRDVLLKTLVADFIDAEVMAAVADAITAINSSRHCSKAQLKSAQSLFSISATGSYFESALNKFAQENPKVPNQFWKPAREAIAMAKSSIERANPNFAFPKSHVQLAKLTDYTFTDPAQLDRNVKERISRRISFASRIGNTTLRDELCFTFPPVNSNGGASAEPKSLDKDVDTTAPPTVNDRNARHHDPEPKTQRDEGRTHGAGSMPITEAHHPIETTVTQIQNYAEFHDFVQTATEDQWTQLFIDPCLGRLARDCLRVHPKDRPTAAELISMIHIVGGLAQSNYNETSESAAGRKSMTAIVVPARTFRHVDTPDATLQQVPTPNAGNWKFTQLWPQVNDGWSTDIAGLAQTYPDPPQYLVADAPKSTQANTHSASTKCEGGSQRPTLPHNLDTTLLPVCVETETGSHYGEQLLREIVRFSDVSGGALRARRFMRAKAPVKLAVTADEIHLENEYAEQQRQESAANGNNNNNGAEPSSVVARAKTVISNFEDGVSFDSFLYNGDAVQNIAATVTAEGFFHHRMRWNVPDSNGEFSQDVTQQQEKQEKQEKQQPSTNSLTPNEVRVLQQSRTEIDKQRRAVVKARLSTSMIAAGRAMCSFTKGYSDLATNA